jgi:cytoskeletal protein CcmA (bactofilin family)
VTPQASSDAAATGSRLIVGPDVKLKGAEILDCDTLVVEGRVEAVMDSRVIRITENGAFCGKVGIDVAEIFGEFDGDLTARQQLIIHSTGRVHGKIRYGKLLVEEGGTLSGDVESLSTSLHTPLSANQSHTTTSFISEKEANAQTKSHLSPVTI